MKPTGDPIVELKNLLHAAGLKPRHYLGQNFLIDPEVFSEILAAADLNPSDTVVEIGSGIGNLTSRLAAKAKRVIAVEKDRNLMPLLKRAVSDQGNVEAVNTDILKYDFSKIAEPFKIIGNIPYYLTSHLVQILLDIRPRPRLIVLMVQKEVSERMVAPKGDLSILGISVQLAADAEITAQISKNSFWPKPKVDSAIIRLEPKDKYPEVKDRKLFFGIIKTAFAGKRKQIHNTLASGLHLDKEKIIEVLTQSNIDPRVRPQDLSLEQWVSLYEAMWSLGKF